MTTIGPLSLIAALILASAFLLPSRTRLRTLVQLFRVQACALVAYLLWSAWQFGEAHLVLIAALVCVLKVAVMPSMLLSIAKKSGAAERLALYVRPATLTFIAMAAIGAAVALARVLVVDHQLFPVAVSFSLVLIGFELLVSHKSLFGQSVGFLMLENGVFFLGLTVAEQMPLFVEIGVLFDLLALLVLATALIRRVQETHASATTDYLQALNDL